MAPNQSCHIRSFSSPSGSRPVAFRIEEELHSLSSLVASSSSSTPEKICDGLRQLGGLHESIKELICLTSFQRSLIGQSQKKWLEEELDESIRLLDLCSAVKDCSTAKKDHIRAIRLALRRRDSKMIMNKVNGYVRFGRKADKEIKNCFRSLKQMEDKRVGDSEISTAIRVLMEVKAITISILQLVSSFSTAQATSPKSSKWSFVSKALSTRKVASEGDLEGDGNGVGVLDIISSCVNSAKGADGERKMKAQSQLQMLEVRVEEFESGLECLFRQMIQLRVSLLNILSP